MLVPNPNYRPNPSRALYLNGVIDDQLLSRLTPEIIKFQHQSREPITVYILDSPGGNAGVMKSILRLLKTSNQDSDRPCEIITVVTAKAQSAAADLLSSGDYAIGYPDSTLLYHGVRTPGIIPALQPLTAERTSLLAHILRLTNDAFAMELARKTEKRFMLRFIVCRHIFPQIRQKNAPKQLSDLDCFLEVISSNLSNGALKVLKRAKERYAQYEPLLRKVSDESQGTSQAETEANRIKAIIDFELGKNNGNSSWTFKDSGGLSRIVEDFFLMEEYLSGHQGERLKHWCRSLAKSSLNKVELERLKRYKTKMLEMKH